MVGVGHHRVVSVLPDVVIGNVPIQMPTVTLVDGVAIHRAQLSVGGSVLLGVGLHQIRDRDLVGGIRVHGVGFLSGAKFTLCGAIGSTLPTVRSVFLRVSGSHSGN